MQRRTFTSFNLLGLVACGLSLVLAACGPIDQKSLDDPGNFETLAKKLHDRGDDAGAADLYQRELQHDPKNITARLALAKIYISHGDFNNAERQYNEAEKYEPENLEVLRAHGKTLIMMGHIEEARSVYVRAVAVDEDDVRSLNGLGVALDYLGQHSAAQQAYRTALDNDPQNMMTLSNLAHSYVLVGGYQDAIKLLEPYANDKSATPALRQNLAEAYGLAGMDADAERMARKDLPADQVKKNMAYYHQERVKFGLVPKFYADLGHEPTEALADTRAEILKSTFGFDKSGLITSVLPNITNAGTTPQFDIHVSGFIKLQKLKDFCAKVAQEGQYCKPYIRPD